MPLSLTLTVSKQVTASFGSQPTIVNQPASKTVVAGSAVSLAVEAAGLAPLAYQWKKGTATLSGKTAAVLTFSSVQSADAGSYTVVVTNGAGAVTSAVAVLTVTPIVQITSAPANVVIVANDRAQLNVVAAGSGALTYQWYQGESGVTTTPLAGATTATLVTPGLGVTTRYWVRITDAAGNVGEDVVLTRLVPGVVEAAVGVLLEAPEPRGVVLPLVVVARAEHAHAERLVKKQKAAEIRRDRLDADSNTVEIVTRRHVAPDDFCRDGHRQPVADQGQHHVQAARLRVPLRAGVQL